MKNGKLKVERGVPIPEKHFYYGKGYSSIIKTMKKGDSVLLPTHINSAAALVSRYGGAKKFTCRTVGPNETRIWKIA